MGHTTKTVIHGHTVADIIPVMGALVTVMSKHTEINDLDLRIVEGYCYIFFDRDPADDDKRMLQLGTSFDCDYSSEDFEPALPGKKIVISLGGGSFGASKKSGEEWVKLFGIELQKMVGGKVYFIDSYRNDMEPELIG